jgi:2-polyprenyl-6-methoxyphenol hydroxylase-like FAD-dependent oxidoreductase
MKDRLLNAGLGYFPTERTKDRISGSPGDDLPVLDEAELNRLIKERAPWFASKIGNVTWRTLVRFEKRQAESFGSGRMWLAGDAAHLAGPAAIQSMNSGLVEANDIAGRITAVLKQGSPLNGLDSYTSRQRRVWDRIRAFRPTPEADPFVQRHGAQLAACLPASGDDLTTLAEKFGLTF